MTRKERLDLLKQIEKDIHVCSLESTLLDDAKSCAIHSVIEELDQEPCETVLDKIRAEIEQTRKMYLDMNDIDWLNGCDYVLSVIDKYNAESEDKE